MIGIVIPVFNRPDYFEQTIESLIKSDLSNTRVLVIDDGNNSVMLQSIISTLNGNFELISKRHSGVAFTLRHGFDMLWRDCETLVNLDADMIVSRTWLQELYALHLKFPDTVVSGLNACDHKPYKSFPEEGYCLKKEGVGGANMMFSNDTYYAIVRSHFDYGSGWDWQLNRTLRLKGKSIAIKMPSVVQHIGVISTMHIHKIFPKADDYVY